LVLRIVMGVIIGCSASSRTQPDNIPPGSPSSAASAVLIGYGWLGGNGSRGIDVTGVLRLHRHLGGAGVIAADDRARQEGLD
jgi:hypothetical protein